MLSVLGLNIQIHADERYTLVLNIRGYSASFLSDIFVLCHCESQADCARA